MLRTLPRGFKRPVWSWRAHHCTHPPPAGRPGGTSTQTQITCDALPFLYTSWARVGKRAGTPDRGSAMTLQRPGAYVTTAGTTHGAVPAPQGVQAGESARRPVPTSATCASGPGAARGRWPSRPATSWSSQGCPAAARAPSSGVRRRRGRTASTRRTSASGGRRACRACCRTRSTAPSYGPLTTPGCGAPCGPARASWSTTAARSPGCGAGWRATPAGGASPCTWCCST